MKLLVILLISFLVLTTQTFLRKGESGEVKTDANLSNIDTNVNNFNAGAVMKNSNIVNIKNINFGKVVQLLGKFSAEANEAASLLQQTQDENEVDTQVSMDGVNTNVNNSNGIAVMENSNVVNIKNVNFGELIQLIGKFAASTNSEVLKLSAPENNQVETNANLNDISTNVNNANFGAKMVNSNIVNISNVNFGKIVQLLGKFQAIAEMNQQSENVSLKQSNEQENVDTTVDLNDVNTNVNNINAGAYMGNSTVLNIKNINFGKVVQLLGEFDANVSALISQAKTATDQ